MSVAQPLLMPRLLIVDDEVNVCSALQRVLRRAGFETLTASSGPDALSKLEAFNPHAVLSDFRMPGMTGAELLGQIKRLYPFTLRVIISGYADVDTVMAGVNEGEICHFVSKPWDDSRLPGKISSLLDERQILATLQQGLATPGSSAKIDMLHHEASVELRSTGSAQLSLEAVMELLRKISTATEEHDLDSVQTLLEKHGGKLSMVAEIGGTQTISLELPMRSSIDRMAS
jgi:two-component system, OmpR family, response regulator VicR